LILAPLLLGSGCGPTTPSPKDPRILQGILIVCDPDDALIYVDDKYMGSVKGLDRRPLPVPAGAHRLEIRKDGYFAHFAEVTVAKGVRQRLKVKLRKEPF